MKASLIIFMALASLTMDIVNGQQQNPYYYPQNYYPQQQQRQQQVGQNLYFPRQQPEQQQQLLYTNRGYQQQIPSYGGIGSAQQVLGYGLNTNNNNFGPQPAARINSGGNINQQGFIRTIDYGAANRNPYGGNTQGGGFGGNQAVGGFGWNTNPRQNLNWYYNGQQRNINSNNGNAGRGVFRTIATTNAAIQGNSAVKTLNNIDNINNNNQQPTGLGKSCPANQAMKACGVDESCEGMPEVMDVCYSFGGIVPVEPRCRCLPGYLRSDKNDIESSCIRKSQCPANPNNNGGPNEALERDRRTNNNPQASTAVTGPRITDQFSRLPPPKMIVNNPQQPNRYPWSNPRVF